VRRLAAAALCLGAAGCATGPGIEDGRYASDKGYRVAMPPAGWRPEGGSPADLELRRDAPPGGITVNASCGGPELVRPLPLVLRHLTFGLDRRKTVEQAETSVAGLPALRAVLEGAADGAPVAVEAVVVRGPRCVYDFLYVAPPAAFEAGRADFHRLVDSLAVAQ
jgi:hypothetical protein